MIEKIRRKFILTAMTAFTLVMAILAIGINVINYLNVTSRLDEYLTHILDFETQMPLVEEENAPAPWNFFQGMFDPEFNYTTRFFSVQLDEDQEVKDVRMDYISSVDLDTAGQMALAVLDSGKTNGYMDNYRYLCFASDSVTYVLFLNAASDIYAVNNLLKLTGLVFIIGFALVLALVCLLSKRAVAPFEKNIRMQRQFITDASHELKTPVTSISTSADVLKMDLGENEWVSNISDQTRRLTGLINNLVKLARLDEELPIPEKTSFSLSEAAWEISEPFEHQAKACGKSFAIDIMEDVDYVGEEELIKQLISILLDNAIKYSAEKGAIQLRLARHHSSVMIEVSNTTEGPQIKQLGRLFERFYRPDESRTTATGGHGIGLSLAKAIAEAHGGKISARYLDQNTINFSVIL